MFTVKRYKLLCLCSN